MTDHYLICSSECDESVIVSWLIITIPVEVRTDL